MYQAAAQRFELVRETDDAFVAAVVNAPAIVDQRLHVARVPPPPRRPSSGDKGSASKDGSRRSKGSFQRSRKPSFGGGSGGWGSAAKGVLQRGDTPEDDDDEDDDDDDDAGVYGVQGSLLVVSHAALRDLVHQLGVLCLPRQSRQVQEFECVAQCCFCGDALLLSRLAPPEQLWSVAVREDHFVPRPLTTHPIPHRNPHPNLHPHLEQVREDHFVRGTDEEGALIVHCQHVMTQLKTLHTKTHHLLAAVHLGDSKWGADSLLFDERLALAEMVRRAPPLASPSVSFRPLPSPCAPLASPCTPAPPLTRCAPTVRAARCVRTPTCS